MTFRRTDFRSKTILGWQRTTSDQEIRSLLGVPDGYSVLNLVAIGEKGETKKAYTDTDLHTENVHYEKY